MSKALDRLTVTQTLIRRYEQALVDLKLPGPKLLIVISHDLDVPMIFRPHNTVVIQFRFFVGRSFSDICTVITDVMASCAVHRHYLQQQADFDKAVLVKYARRPKLSGYGSARWQDYRNKLMNVDKSGLQW